MGEPSYNSSKANGCGYKDNLDTCSTTAASTPCASWPTSEDDDRHLADVPQEQGQKQGQQILGMLCANNMQDMPPPPPPPPPLPSKTRLQSRAALFVPKSALASQAPPYVPMGAHPAAPPNALPSWTPAAQHGGGSAVSGKDCLQNVIQSTLGSQLWDLSMVDCQSFTGEWYTAVEITIPAPMQSHALQSLIQSLQSSSPNMTIMPSEDSSHLSVQYCAADKEQLCWEFTHKGRCPRRSTCRWAHAVLETFMISFVLQPVMQWVCDTAMPLQTEVWAPPVQAPTVDAQVQYVPVLVPVEHLRDQTGVYSFPDPANRPWPDSCVQEQSFTLGSDKLQPVTEELKGVKPVAPSRIRSGGRKWADIQEDSDGDEAIFS